MWTNKLCFKYKFLIQNPKIINSRTFSVVSRVFSNVNKTYLKVMEKYNVSSNIRFIKLIPKIKCIRNHTTLAGQSNSKARVKRVGLWMVCCTSMVYVGITLGAYTRLTESGLSMVTWRFTFESYPTSEIDWISEFNKYKDYPEYKLLKKDLTLADFKKIYINEYVHRNWGRAIGIMFLLPAVFYWKKGYFLSQMKKRVLAFGLLIAAQGLLGWYMVKSGLEDRFHKESDVPRVSQYRLAAHLTLALILYTGFLWTTLELLAPAEKIILSQLKAKKLKILAHVCKGMVFFTAISGAFVAGLDAGLVYNSFPKMGDNWIPKDIFTLSPFYKNFTENPTTVQFDHRILGISTFSLIMATWLMSRKYSLPHRPKKAVAFFALAASLQVILGISTLLHYVPVSQGVAHQTGSVLLLSMATWFAHELKNLKCIPKI